MYGGLLHDWELTPSGEGVSTLVVLGKSGNGKSATGNSILGKKEFVSAFKPCSVTSTCALRSTELKGGRTVNVIDTPGLFDLSTASDLIVKEIVNCISLAKDGIHAVLEVFSIKSRFTSEEEAAVQKMISFFSERIVDHMIIVFTGGDAFGEEGYTFQDYISDGPEPLKNIIRLCKNRVILFDNNTRDKHKRAKQVQELLSLVDSVVADNGGRPFSNEIIDEVKNGALRILDEVRELEAMKGRSKQHIAKLKKQINKSYEDQLKRVTEMVEMKLGEAIARHEKQLAEEQSARLQAQEFARETRAKSEEKMAKLREELKRDHREIQAKSEEIAKLREELKRVREEFEEFKKNSNMCAIL